MASILDFSKFTRAHLVCFLFFLDQGKVGLSLVKHCFLSDANCTSKENFNLERWMSSRLLGCSLFAIFKSILRSIIPFHSAYINKLFVGVLNVAMFLWKSCGVPGSTCAVSCVVVGLNFMPCNSDSLL